MRASTRVLGVRRSRLGAEQLEVALSELRRDGLVSERVRRRTHQLIVALRRVVHVAGQPREVVRGRRLVLDQLGGGLLPQRLHLLLLAASLPSRPAVLHRGEEVVRLRRGRIRDDERLRRRGEVGRWLVGGAEVAWVNAAAGGGAVAVQHHLVAGGRLRYLEV